ncbi:MAG: hypothetical protein RLY16_1557 [Bacteroidota bacterium]
MASKMGTIIEFVKDIRNVLRGFKYKKSQYYWRYHYGRRLHKYKDVHQGEDCFIIANGPSLKNMNLECLADYHTFSLNKAHLLKELFKIDFTYHVCVDDIVLAQIHDIVAQGKMGCTSFLSINGTTHQNLTPIQNDHTEYLFTDAPWSFYKDITQPICEGYTVTYVALQLAFYMGFKNVYLVGVDHSWSNNTSSNVVDTLKGEDKNHFHPDYFKNMKWHMPDIKGNEASYALARHQYDAAGRSVLDATVGGKLQVFPKIAFEEALQLCKKKNG